MPTSQHSETVWNGCYDDHWRGLIVDDAFAHPAKMARGLVSRIFDHLFERGYISKGSLIVDPFGGIGTTAIEGASRGCRVVCVELESKFVELAKKNFELHFFFWESCGDPHPVIIQGDSRKLRQVISEANVIVSSPPYSECLKGDNSAKETAAESRAKRITPGGSLGQSQRHAGYGGPGNLGNLLAGNVDATVTSPPYESALDDRGRDPEKTAKRKARFNEAHPEMAAHIQKSVINYGQSSNGNIGNDHGETFWSAARLIVQQCFEILRPGGVAVFVCKDFVRNKKRVPFSDDWRRLCEACGFVLVEWIKASLVKETVEATLFNGHETKRKERKSFFRRLAEKKGSPRIDHEDVLIMVKPSGAGQGQVDAVASSPPYSDGCIRTGGEDPNPAKAGHIGSSCGWRGYSEESAGQLGAMKSGDVDAVIGSPPFSEAGSQPPNISGSRPVTSRWKDQPERTGEYGTTPGQLGSMKP